MNLYKSKHNGLFFEIGIPEKSNSNLLMILPGFPEYPRPKEFISKLVSEGYCVVYPRYNGTFESEGHFLEKNLTENLLKLIEFLKNDKKITELYGLDNIKLDFKNIIILGNSFGGSVGLHLATMTKIIKKFVILAPILDFKNHNRYKNEQDLKKFRRFLKEGFPNLYRFNPKNYDSLLKGEVIPSVFKNVGKLNGEIILLHGDKDNVVSIENFKKLKEIEFITLKGKGHIEFITLKGKGHISFKDLDFEFLKKLLK